MPADLDPYCVWFGIPPAEQPPNFYRLLGIPPFTSDLLAIEIATENRLACLKPHRFGPHADVCQELLNDITCVADCLKDPDRKAAYDEALRKAIPAKIQPVVPAPREQNQPKVSSASTIAVPVGNRQQPRRQFISRGNVAYGLAFLIMAFLASYYQLAPRLLTQSRNRNSRTATATPSPPRTTDSFPTVLQPTSQEAFAQQNPVETNIEAHSTLRSEFPGQSPEKSFQEDSSTTENTKNDIALRQVQLLESQVVAIAAGDLSSALNSVEQLAVIEGRDKQKAKIAFLDNLLMNPPPNVPGPEVAIQLLIALEDVCDSGDLEFAKAYAAKVLVAVRRTMDSELERRATLVALKVQ